MDILFIIFTFLLGSLLSLLAIHSWVFICDCIIGFLKRIFRPNRRKSNINWHTIDQEEKKISTASIETKKQVLHENERLY